ncbi:MAG: hypothetical protein A2Z60_03065 [Nitrospirae bacterium RIFCSPLOWO2_02_42_7]|nr:MAG: hypothetical protein A2Z60_03065 [Nitrospirae bacterium RIFCSPLOWO2_02_42_7]OGW60239.1 MAG: hypothetical protein A3D21_05955 [Nitrospirae bacterium RIFCSPHIGHO2_02_FULL_42_12]
MNIFEKRNLILGMEFDRYIRLHPEFADRIPDNAHIILLLEGDEEFNNWSSGIGKRQAEEGQSIVYVTIKKLGPVSSRIKELEVGVS